MAIFSVSDTRIAGICAAVPANVSSNTDLDILTEKQRANFIKTVGIQTRRVAPPELCASDLCVAAARRLLECVDCNPGEIGALLTVTQTPDYSLPGNSMLAQDRLGLPRTSFLIDQHQGCAGYVYGLATLSCVLKASGIGKGLLLCGDTLTRLLDSTDTGTVPIFSDAGSATLLTCETAPAMHFNLGSDGSGADVICAGGGSRRDAGMVPNLTMNGVNVARYVMEYVEPNVRELLDYARYSVDNVDHYVLHQANRLLNRSVLNRLGVPLDKAPESLHEYGNTSTATIPITVCHRLRQDLENRHVLMAGFGAGFSWGSALVRFGDVACPEVLEVSSIHEY